MSMFKPRKFKLRAEDFVDLLHRSMGSGIASDHVTVEGQRVGWMYREKPDGEVDSGWRFFSGSESQEYADNADNFAIYDLNTIANYDRAIIPHLESEFGTRLERVEGTNQFQRVS
jgi:hypothetical protein